MRRIFCIFIFLLIVLPGCLPARQNPTATIATPANPILSHPLLTSWDITGNPSITQNDYSLAILGLGLLDQRIVLFYALSGSDAAAFFGTHTLQITDDLESASNLAKVIPLPQVDQIEPGMLIFEPRHTGVRELYLHVSAAADTQSSQRFLLARLNGSLSDDFLGRQFWSATEINFELAGDQISMLWGPPPEDTGQGANAGQPTAIPPISHAGVTSTPYRYRSSIPLPPGITVQEEITFKIVNRSDGQNQYRGLQLLSDGNALIVTDGISAWPTPIWIASPTPPASPSTPYPHPASTS